MTQLFFLFSKKILPVVCVFTLVLSACGTIDGSPSGKTFEVAEEFLDFYMNLGGESVLGPAISKMTEVNSYQCQFTANALMCINPNLSGYERFNLYPLGNQLNLREAAIPTDGDAALVVNGFSIYGEFIPLYTQFSFATYAGNPISQVHMNYAQERVEQFFENVGFYRNFSDPQGRVKLLAYGAAACTKGCRYHPASAAELPEKDTMYNSKDLLEDLENVKESKTFGKPLSQPYIAADGNLEQVYASIVLYRDYQNGLVRLRPLPMLLGMLTSEPGPQLYGKENGMVFYAVREGLGYHVPESFDQFIADHGGTAVSGDPISEVIQYEPGVFRQCFTNYCLDYIPEARKNKQVSLAELGNQYLQSSSAQTQITPPPEATAVPSSYVIQVGELFAPLPMDSAQQIHLVVLNAADMQPLAGMTAEIVVNLPDGTTYKASMPATMTDGSSTLTLPVMKKIDNGTILTYQACVVNPSGGQQCQNGSYLVWSEP